MSAYEQAREEAYDVVSTCLQDLLEREGYAKAAGEDFEVGDCILEVVDSALVYHNDIWACAFGLDDDHDMYEELVAGKEVANFEEILAARAFANLYAATLSKWRFVRDSDV